MTVRIRIRAGSQGIRRAALFAALTMLIVAGAVLVRPAPPAEFDYTQFERERYAAAMAKKTARAEPREAKQPAHAIENLDQKIENTLIDYGTGALR